MSLSNTSFNNIIEDQISKLKEVQSIIISIKEMKSNTDITSKLKMKYEEIQTFVEKLAELKNALNNQVNLCADIKDISATLNYLMQQITNTNDDDIFPTDNMDTSTINEKSSNINYYSPAENNVYNEKEIRPIRPTSLNLNLLEIEPLTQEEYLKIPKYMVGRISIDVINKFIEIINKSLSAKYTLLSKPKSSLKGADLQQYRDYKTQETEETKGKYFVIEGDIARQQNKKNLDKHSCNLLVILRHVKRVYENRTSHLLRIVLN